MRLLRPRDQHATKSNRHHQGLDTAVPSSPLAVTHTLLLLTSVVSLLFASRPPGCTLFSVWAEGFSLHTVVMLGPPLASLQFPCVTERFHQPSVLAHNREGIHLSSLPLSSACYDTIGPFTLLCSLLLLVQVSIISQMSFLELLVSA